MDVRVNGKLREVPDGATVAEVLEIMSLNADRVVVECNREILGKETYPEMHLREGDALEIVHFVGGG